MEARKLKSKQKLESYKSKLIEYKQINANLQNTVEDLERALNQEKQHNQEYYEQINNEFREKEEVTNEKIKEMENFYQEKFVNPLFFSILF